MKDAIATIRCIGQSFIMLADQLENASPAKPPENAGQIDAAVSSKPTIKVEDVRAVLADISRSGKTVQMKELLGRYGAERLSDVNPQNYAALLAAAEEVKNA